jgi:hypothetical protein
MRVVGMSCFSFLFQLHLAVQKQLPAMAKFLLEAGEWDQLLIPD